MCLPDFHLFLQRVSLRRQRSGNPKFIRRDKYNPSIRKGSSRYPAVLDRLSLLRKDFWRARRYLRFKRNTRIVCWWCLSPSKRSAAAYHHWPFDQGTLRNKCAAFSVPLHRRGHDQFVFFFFFCYPVARVDGLANTWYDFPLSLVDGNVRTILLTG